MLSQPQKPRAFDDLKEAHSQGSDSDDDDGEGSSRPDIGPSGNQQNIQGECSFKIRKG